MNFISKLVVGITLTQLYHNKEQLVLMHFSKFFIVLITILPLFLQVLKKKKQQ